jgi:hypothetical protein
MVVMLPVLADVREDDRRAAVRPHVCNALVRLPVPLNVVPLHCNSNVHPGHPLSLTTFILQTSSASRGWEWLTKASSSSSTHDVSPFTTSPCSSHASQQGQGAHGL